MCSYIVYNFCLKVGKWAKKHTSSSVSEAIFPVGGYFFAPEICNFLDALSHTCWIPVGEVVLNLFLVCGLNTFKTLLQVVSGSALLFFITRSEGCVVVSQKDLDVLCHAWFLV